jgi:hypothetical protein
MGANGTEINVDDIELGDIELDDGYVEESVEVHRTAYVYTEQALQTGILESSGTDVVILEPLDVDANSLDFGELAAKIATRDAKAQPPILETPTESDWGNSRIIQMIKNVFPQVRGPKGVAWCACAVTTWWIEAAQQKGLTAALPGRGPTTDSKTPTAGNGYVPRWEYWAKTTGRFAATPIVGAAVLYNPTARAEADGTATVKPGKFASHIGIVQSINSDNTFNAVDGNYGQKITFRKNLSTSRGVIGFVLPII